MSSGHVHLERDATSPRVARRFVADYVRGCECFDDVTLLVSELVANALEHAQSDADLTVLIEGPVIRVEVADGSPTEPTVRDMDPDALRGRGLQLVAALAHRWGVAARPPGKAVWFEIDDPSCADAEAEPLRA